MTTSEKMPVIGKPPHHWVFHASKPSSSAADLLDLSRPPAPYSAPSPSTTVRLRTTAEEIALAPAKSALIIIDMQNFFLSAALGRDPRGAGHAAMKTLLSKTIPACRKARIRIVWLNWGLSDQDLAEMPPSLLRGFGALNQFKNSGPENSSTVAEPANASTTSKPSSLYRGFGVPLGEVTLEDGSVVDAGRTLLQNQWNSSLPPGLLAAYQSGSALSERPDVWIHKNRASGLWGAKTAATSFLESQGICTLLFAGVNTDQCVGGSLLDAHSRGFDCVLLKDACGTTSPKACTEMIEYNVGRSWGFVVDSEELDRAVDEMISAR